LLISLVRELTENLTLQALQEEPRGQTPATSDGIVSRCESTATRKEWSHSIRSAWEPPECEPDFRHATRQDVKIGGLILSNFVIRENAPRGEVTPAGHPYFCSRVRA
jgi:hypothetical protein